MLSESVLMLGLVTVSNSKAGTVDPDTTVVVVVIVDVAVADVAAVVVEVVVALP